jgi:hypothetical protein
LKKKFLIVGLAGWALAEWAFRTAAAGAIYATVAFFTKEGWERWKFRRRD